MSPQKIRFLFLVKGVVVPIAWLAMVIWAFVRVPPSSGLFAGHATITGTQFSWNWLSALNSALGIYSSLTVNIPDFTVSSHLRWCPDGFTECHGSVMRKTRKRKQSHLLGDVSLNATVDSQYVQPLIIPIAFILCSFAGIAVTSAGIQLYGQVLWDPLLLIDKWDNRAAAFFASFAFALATIGTNISANSLGAGNDMTVLLPKVRSCIQLHAGRQRLSNIYSISTSDAGKSFVLSLEAGPCVPGRSWPSELATSKDSPN